MNTEKISIQAIQLFSSAQAWEYLLVPFELTGNLLKCYGISGHNSDSTKQEIEVLSEYRIEIFKIEEEALKKMLVEGHLGGAILDVTEEEPLPADSPLWDLPNLLITPHVSGNYHMRQILDTVVKIAGENLEAFLDGKELVNEVDLCTGYRKFKA